MRDMDNRVLDVRDLRVVFHTDFGDRTVTDDISYHVGREETLGIVGESGCGKSVTNLAVMGLLPRNGEVVGGEVDFDGKNLLKMTPSELDKIRGKDITMVFQDALAGLNPVFTVGNQLTEEIRVHLKLPKKKADAMAVDILGRMGLPDPTSSMKKYPHELSGGMRQRVMIAMALVCEPQLLIADEPTTALDVTIQAQIMGELRKARRELHMSMILVTHDIGLVAQNADRVMVMYAGQFIEEADVRELFANPLHPYTNALLAAAPGIDDAEDRRLESIKGSVPQQYDEIVGCRFRSRCPYASDECKKKQEFITIGDHRVRCHRAAEIQGDMIGENR
jgi:peptide/nickel transport system ATP-binding protein